MKLFTKSVGAPYSATAVWFCPNNSHYIVQFSPVHGGGGGYTGHWGSTTKTCLMT